MIDRIFDSCFSLLFFLIYIYRSYVPGKSLFIYYITQLDALSIRLEYPSDFNCHWYILSFCVNVRYPVFMGIIKLSGFNSIFFHPARIRSYFIKSYEFNFSLDFKVPSNQDPFKVLIWFLNRSIPTERAGSKHNKVLIFMNLCTFKINSFINI